RSFTKSATGTEFTWDFPTLTTRLREIVPGLPISEAQYGELVAACRGLDDVEKAAKLIDLTIPSDS
ncbi:MAG: hypothetical protein VYB59_00260, partial [Pseudomonadota bacterium]|nr:hypothetical protein [Pseudomonadota bacterium]